MTNGEMVVCDPGGSIACVDVDYRARPDGTVDGYAAAVALAAWLDALALEEVVVRVPAVRAYEPGSFYKRELPCVLAALGALASLVGVVVIDG